MHAIKMFTLSAITAVALMSFQSSSNTLKPVYPATAIGTFSPKVLWAKDSHDFGEIQQGTPVSVEFKFTNEGDDSLIITDVATSCECTASDYSKEPIAPGKSSKIKVTYNAVAKGSFTKTITVKSNDKDAVKMLTIKGMVK